LLLICTLTTVWGLRLSWNFWRKGGYGNLITHEEDYRWPILRKRINSPTLFLLFNLTFIAAYQNFILLLIALPAHHVMNGPAELNVWDIIVGFGFVAFFAMETIADLQHWDFHERKYSVDTEVRKNHPDSDVRDGFYQHGLFQFCRHPNYFAEQSMWIMVYCFTLTRASSESLFSLDWGNNFVNPYFLGAFLLITLFQGSMAFSEEITASKYPEYKRYQSTTSQCIPFFTAKEKSH